MISVCMATYNGAKFLKAQIDSILTQLSDSDELIISDDGSTDDTLAIIESYHDPRIKLFHHKSAKGSPIKKAKANFENAMKQARGEYIFLSDQDDIWESDKISTLTPALSDYGCVQHSKYELYPDGKRLRSEPLQTNHTLISAVRSMHFAGCCMGMTREFLDKALPIPDSVESHDGWLAALAANLNCYCFINIPLLNHRVHDSNASGNIRNNILFKISYRAKLLYEVIKRSRLVK